MRAEVLAPAGSMQALVAAVRCGADAVYLGGKNFNARRNAGNFDGDELRQAVDYCRRHGVKVYLTLNTLVTDSEIDGVYEEIKAAAKSGVDALIVQDLGVAALAKEVCPDMPLHASTQMSVQSKYGVELLGEMGYKRAVLPRELSKEEIKEISEYTDLPLEHFVHGAQCMCLSGQCLMSSVIGGRSGNRGLCAQPCRLPFGVNGRGGHNLSLKDMSLIERAGELEETGVSSLKIEGRMKRPEYVAAAVTACRNSLDGKTDEELLSSLYSVFSRSGFTTGYFDAKRGKDMFGIRTKDDVVSASGVLKGLEKLYEKETPVFPVDMHLTVTSSEARLTVKSGNSEYTAVSPEIPQTAQNKCLTQEEAIARISKCGGTVFYPGAVTAEIGPGMFLPAAVLNALRREALAALEEKNAAFEEKTVKQYTFTKSHREISSKQTHIRFFSEKQIPGSLPEAQRIIIPLETDEKTVRRLASAGAQIAAEIPVNIFSNADKYIEKLKTLVNYGVTLAWCCNLDGVAIAKKAGVPFASGFGMNALNTLSLSVLKGLGARDVLLSSEIRANDVKTTGGDACKGILLYGKLPLMVTRNCPVANKLSCAECGGHSFLEDRTGARFPVICKNGASFILNSAPLCNFDRAADFECDYSLIYFTDETAGECSDILNLYREGKNISGYTRGLHYRNVL